jgi:hypothetical protein
MQGLEHSIAGSTALSAAQHCQQQQQHCQQQQHQQQGHVCFMLHVAGALVIT